MNETCEWIHGITLLAAHTLKRGAAVQNAFAKLGVHTLSADYKSTKNCFKNLSHQT